MLSLPLREGTNQIQSLVKTYFASGGFHLAVNGVDAAVLEKALKSPEEYRHIMVKISGFSAKYVRLSRELQQAILERVRNGM